MHNNKPVNSLHPPGNIVHSDIHNALAAALLLGRSLWDTILFAFSCGVLDSLWAVWSSELGISKGQSLTICGAYLGMNYNVIFWHSNVPFKVSDFCIASMVAGYVCVLSEIILRASDLIFSKMSWQFGHLLCQSVSLLLQCMWKTFFSCSPSLTNKAPENPYQWW